MGSRLGGRHDMKQFEKSDQGEPHVPEACHDRGCRAKPTACVLARQKAVINQRPT